MDMGCLKWSRKEEAKTQKDRQEVEGGGRKRWRERERREVGEADDTRRPILVAEETRNQENGS